MKRIKGFGEWLVEQNDFGDPVIAQALAMLHPELAAQLKAVIAQKSITQKGESWIVKVVKGRNLVYDVPAGDLVDEYLENLAIIARTAKRMQAVDLHWERDIVPAYGDIEYNRMSRDSYETSQEKVQLIKAYEQNLLFHGYLEWRIATTYHQAKSSGRDPGFIASVDRLLK